MLAENQDIIMCPSGSSGRSYPVAGTANRSPTFSNPYNRQGLLGQNCPELDRKLDLRSDTGGASVPELQLPQPISSLDSSHRDRNDIGMYTLAGRNHLRSMVSVGGSSARKYPSSSPDSSRSTSPNKRPWYPGGRRSSSGGRHRSDRDDGENAYVVHRTPGKLFDASDKIVCEATVSKGPEGGSIFGSVIEERRRGRRKLQVSVENTSPSGQPRQGKPTPVEDADKAFGARRIPSGYRDRTSLSPSKKATNCGPGLEAGPEERRINQLTSPLIRTEIPDPGRKPAARTCVPRESLATTRARVRDLQSRGRPQQQTNTGRSLAVAKKRKDEPRCQDTTVFVGHSEQVLSLAHRKDILFSAAADGTAKAWDTYTQRCLATYEGHRNAVWGIEVTDRTLITGSADGTVRFWDIETAQSLHVIDLRSAVRDVVVVGGFLAVATSSPGVEVIDLNSMRRHGILEGHLMAVSALTSLRGEACLVSGSHDTFIRVWDPKTGNCEALLGGHRGTVGALCTVSCPSPRLAHGKAHPGGEAESGADTLIVSGSGDTTVRVWGHAAGGAGAGEWACRAVLEGHRHGVWAVDSSFLSGAFATGGGDATIKLWAPTKSFGDVNDGGDIYRKDERPSRENEQQEQTRRWECVGGVRGAAGAVGAILMSEHELVFGTSEAVIARFPLQLCMPGR